MQELKIFEGLIDKGLTLAFLAAALYFVVKYFVAREKETQARIDKIQEKHDTRESELMKLVIEMTQKTVNKTDALSDFTRILGKLLKEPDRQAVKSEITDKVNQMISQLNINKTNEEANF